MIDDIVYFHNEYQRRHGFDDCIELNGSKKKAPLRTTTLNSLIDYRNRNNNTRGTANM